MAGQKMILQDLRRKTSLETFFALQCLENLPPEAPAARNRQN
jgi:hypothetical protein